MYEYFKGRLAEKTPTHTVVDVQGIGYRIATPSRIMGILPQPGEEVKLYVAWVVRELSQALFGFLTKEERDLFELLITLSGVGPKTALAMLNHFSPEQLDLAVQEENIQALGKVPGIGKKTAERLLVDLKGRLKIGSFSQKVIPSKIQDALHALLNLGYARAQAEKGIQIALKELPEESDLSLLIASAIKKMHSK